MAASQNGHEVVVRTLLEGGADVNAKSEVRNQMMMVMIIILALTIIMMMMSIVMSIVMSHKSYSPHTSHTSYRTCVYMYAHRFLNDE